MKAILSRVIITSTIFLILAVFIGNASTAESSQSEEREAVELLNNLREQQGLKPLVWNPSSKLQAAAETRARELERKFSHTRPDGRNCDSVLKEFGFRYRRYGENIAYGTNLSARGVIKMWSNSPGHNENMMSPHFREVGIASYRGHGRNVYWVQIFLTK